MGWKLRCVKVQKGNFLAVPSRSAPFFKWFQRNGGPALHGGLALPAVCPSGYGRRVISL